MKKYIYLTCHSKGIFCHKNVRENDRSDVLFSKKKMIRPLQAHIYGEVEIEFQKKSQPNGYVEFIVNL